MTVNPPARKRVLRRPGAVPGGREGPGFLWITGLSGRLSGGDLFVPGIAAPSGDAQGSMASRQDRGEIPGRSSI